MLSTAHAETVEPEAEQSGFRADDIAGTYLTFDLAGQVLGVDVRNVREILDQATIRLLPNAPHDIEGIVDIREQSIPIVDMGSRLSLPRSADCEETRIIVFEIRQEGRVCPIGVIADRVRNVALIGPDAIEAPPELADSSWRSSVLRAVARQDDSVILLLDVTSVFGAGDVQLDMSFV